MWAPSFNEDAKDTDFFDTGIKITVSPLSKYDNLIKTVEVLDELSNLSGKPLNEQLTSSSDVLVDIFTSLIVKWELFGEDVEVSPNDCMAILKYYPYMINLLGTFIKNEANFFPEVSGHDDNIPEQVKGIVNVLIPCKTSKGLKAHYFSGAYISFDVDEMFEVEFERRLSKLKTTKAIAKLFSDYANGWDEEFFGEEFSNDALYEILAQYQYKELLDQIMCMVIRDKKTTDESVVKAAEYIFATTRLNTPNDKGDTLKQNLEFRRNKARIKIGEEYQKLLDAEKMHPDIEEYIQLYATTLHLRNPVIDRRKPEPINTSNLFHHFNYLGRDLKPCEYKAIVSMDDAYCNAIGEILNEMNERDKPKETAGDKRQQIERRNGGNGR
ncbi:hypothetical protein PLEI_1446 [Photobacterium leiognathi lrivu.4.1]|uniref:Uncharacterized protein n=1 Tax=Photobacterium leiognathi lrivu.4.1 TaxID=1248232 RepID=A0A0U1P5N4_PHOLE|nr:hypothetical protein PLEI_1446 [Photobacterium leiognathi lrivu.4.1]